MSETIYSVRDGNFFRTLMDTQLVESEKLLNILRDVDTYTNPALSITRQTDDKEFTALRGSMLSIGCKNTETRYGYDHAVAHKIGNIACQRFLSDKKPKITLIKSKREVLHAGNHMTRRSIISEMYRGCNTYVQNHTALDELDLKIFTIEKGFIFINLTDVVNVSDTSAELLIQTATALVTAAYPDARILY